MIRESFERYCLQCGQCLDRCPVYEDLCIIETALAVLKGGVDEGISRCLTCGLCEEDCPQDLSLKMLIKEARLAMVRRNGLTQGHRVVDPLDPASALSIADRERLPWDIPMGQAEVVYYPGCFVDLFYPDVMRAAVGLLRLAGVEFTVLRGTEYCCGVPSYNTGHTAPLETNSGHLIDEVVHRGGKLVLTSCPGCYLALARAYPTIVDSMPFKVVPLTAYLARLVDDGTLLPGSQEAKVRYHDPCHLLRSAKVDDRARDLLSSVDGTIVLNPGVNDATCCGFGGGVRNNHPELALGISKRVCRKAMKEGAVSMVTNCSGCLQNLEGAKVLPVCDATVYKAVALGIDVGERDDGFMRNCFRRAWRGQ